MSNMTPFEIRLDLLKMAQVAKLKSNLDLACQLSRQAFEKERLALRTALISQADNFIKQANYFK